MRFLPFLLIVPALATEPAPKATEPGKNPAAETKAPEPVTRDGSVTIDGQRIDYEVTAAKLILRQKDGTPRASVFHISYLRKDVEDTSKRPVMFAFNGGPGSSAVWLHLGMLGPKRLEFPEAGTRPPVPPATLVPNDQSILDVADLVFIDPVATGYSRPEKDVKPAEFLGVYEDIESVGDFIRRWVTEHDRWDSPKFLLGESYGGIRAAGLSSHLQSRYGMSLNGVILLSSLLELRTSFGAEGDTLTYSVYLPAFTAMAHHHGLIEGDRDALVAEASAFAWGPYALALLKGNTLEPEVKKELAATMSRLTGIDAQLLETLDLRLDPTRFRMELLRDRELVLGRFDARVAWPVEDDAEIRPDFDPSYSLVYGPFATAQLAYLTGELGWDEDAPYEILAGVDWNWGDMDSGLPNLGPNLLGAMRDNPHLRVLVMKAHADLATPPEGIDYSLRQLDAPPSLLDRISSATYEAGHMFYLNPPDLVKSRRDLVEFISASLEPAAP